MSVNQPTSLGIGTLVNERYTVVAVVGRGGLGTVYQVRDERSGPGAVYALKETLDLSDGARDQFEKEARWLQQLDHPNIPRVRQSFEWRDRLYLVMDFISGENLELRLLRNGERPLPEPEVLGWARPICDALTYLHSQTPPIIHRDVKPANIIVAPTGRPTLVDLGIAKEHLPGMQNITAMFIRKAGTEGYAPPEQYISNGSTGPWSDIYSLGATLYHLLTGHVPASAVERAALDGQLVAPRALNPAMTVAVEAIVVRALAIRPQDRYPTMREMLAALGDESFTKTVRIFPMTALPSKPLCPRCNRPMTAPAPMCANCAQELAGRANGLARDSLPPGASRPPAPPPAYAPPMSLPALSSSSLPPRQRRAPIERPRTNLPSAASSSGSRRSSVAVQSAPRLSAVAPPGRLAASSTVARALPRPLRIGLVAVAMLAIVGLVILGVRVYQQANPDESSPQSTVNGYFSALQSQNYQQAYNYYSTKGVSQLSYTQFVQNQQVDARDLGGIVQTSIKQIVPNSVDNQQVIVAVNRSQASTPVTYTVTLSNNGGRWQIDSVTNGG